MYKVRSSENGHPLKFRLCDTRGLEEGQGMDTSDLVAVLDGHLPDRYQVVFPILTVHDSTDRMRILCFISFFFDR